MYMLRYALMNEIFIHSWEELTGFLWILTINTDENICYIRKYARQYTQTAYDPLAYHSGYQSRLRPVPLSQENNNALPLARFEPIDLKSNTLSLRRCTHVLCTVYVMNFWIWFPGNPVLTLITPVFLSWKYHLIITVMISCTPTCFFSQLEANSMNPDQTAPKGAVWSGCILFAILATNWEGRWESRWQM